MKYLLTAALMVVACPAFGAIKLADPGASGIDITPVSPAFLDEVRVDVWFEGSFTVPTTGPGIAIDDRIDTGRDADLAFDFFDNTGATLAPGTEVVSLYFNITEDPVNGTFDFYDFTVKLPGAAIVGMAGLKDTLLGHESLSLPGFMPLDLPNIANSSTFVGMEDDHDSVVDAAAP